MNIVPTVNSSAVVIYVFPEIINSNCHALSAFHNLYIEQSAAIHRPQATHSLCASIHHPYSNSRPAQNDLQLVRLLVSASYGCRY
jgi:hypothetical protein